MNKILSINNKFFEISPKEFIDIVNKYNSKNLVQGFEFAISNINEEEYIKNLIKISNNNFIFNLHGPGYKNIKDDFEYLDFAYEISNMVENKVNIVYHPECKKTEEQSISSTINKLDTIFEYIYKKQYNNKIDISIENLNILNGVQRLKKESFLTLFNIYKDLKFTYDIGHEIVDRIMLVNLDDIYIERLNNFHIHTYDRISKNDHYPICNINDEPTLKILLEKYSKDKNVVLEYALDYICGDSFEEKMKNYIKSAEKIVL